MNTIDFTRRESEEKQLSLFPPEGIEPKKEKKTREGVLNDYEGFVEKFKPKKTTDDCYTPPEIYDTVLEWLGENVDLKGREIKRPFYPGGDYKSEHYPDNCVVVDNPPFSILSKIINFYVASGVKFFLFAPTLTMASAKISGRTDIDITYITCGVTVTYANGAIVNTSFVSNLFGDVRVWACHELYQRIKRVNDRCVKEKKVRPPVFDYPGNVTSAAILSRLPKHGVSIKIKKQECRYISALDSQKRVSKKIFGSGFLLSDRAAAEKAAAEKMLEKNIVEEKAMQEKAAAEKAAAEKAAAIVWELSEREKRIIKELNENSNGKEIQIIGE